MAKISPEYLARTGTEHGEQTALFCWAKMAMWLGWETAWDINAYGNAHKFELNNPAVPQLKWMHAIANGGGRTAVQGAQLKAEGVRSGVADVSLPCPGSLLVPGALRFDLVVRFPGLYIEMKRVDGVPSDFADEQIEFARYVIRNGFCWIPCFGWQQAAVVIQAFLTGGSYEQSEKQQKVLDRVNVGL